MSLLDGFVHCLFVLAVEWQLASQHLEDNDSEGPQICAEALFLISQRLWSDIVLSPDDLVFTVRVLLKRLLWQAVVRVNKSLDKLLTLRRDRRYA